MARHHRGYGSFHERLRGLGQNRIDSTSEYQDTSMQDFSAPDYQVKNLIF